MVCLCILYVKESIRMKRLIYLLSVIVAIFCGLPVKAASGVTIHGRVTDTEQKPIEFVTVRIGGTAIGTNTGLEGEYRLSAPQADTLTVFFSCIGYREVKRQLIDAKGDVTLDVKMTPNSVQLGQVEVTELRKQTGSMVSLSRDDMKLSPDISGGSVEAMVTTLAGVNSSNEMSSQYSVRGGTYDENSVYINGIEVHRPLLITSGQQEGLSVINPDLVGAIGFSTGGFTADYGDKMSSVLDITYRDPESFEGSFSASLMGGSLAIGQSSKKFSQIHGLRFKRNASLLSSMETKGEYDPTFFDYQTNITFKPNDRLRINFLGNIAINNYKFTPVNRQTNFGTTTDAKQFTVYFDGHEKDRFETWFGALSASYRVHPSTELSLLGSGYLGNELVAYDISGEYWLDQAGNGEVGGELGVGRYHEHARNRLRSTVFSITAKGATSIRKHTLSYGLTFNSEKIMERSREWERRDSAGYTLPSDGQLVKLIYNMSSHHDISSTRLSFFVADNFRVNSSSGYFNINGGLRFSYWSFNKEFLFSPRVNIGFVPERNPAWTFRFATGLYYQQPFFKEYRYEVADELGNCSIRLNKDIKSQRSIHFIAGADYTFRALNRPFKVSAEAYYKVLGNLIPYEIDNLKIVYSGFNTSKGYTMGLDMKFFGQFVPGTDSWLSFSLMKTSEDLNGKKVPRPTDQRYSVALYFTDFFPKVPKLKFSLRGIFSDGLPVTAPHSSRDKGYFRTPAYKRLDIGLMYGLLMPPKDGQPRDNFWRHFKSIWIGVDCFNLLGISNVSSYYWVTDVNDIQYAVPNYLTGRQLNVRLTIDF